MSPGDPIELASGIGQRWALRGAGIRYAVVAGAALLGLAVGLLAAPHLPDGWRPVAVVVSPSPFASASPTPSASPSPSPSPVPFASPVFVETQPEMTALEVRAYCTDLARRAWPDDPPRDTDDPTLAQIGEAYSDAQREQAYQQCMREHGYS